MVKNRALLALLLATTLAGSASAASATRPTAFHPTRPSAVVADSITRSDSPMTRLLFMRDRLILALRISHGVVWVDLDVSTVDDDFGLDMNDGPEGVDPLGAKEQGLRESGPVPVTSNTYR